MGGGRTERSKIGRRETKFVASGLLLTYDLPTKLMKFAFAMTDGECAATQTRQIPGKEVALVVATLWWLARALPRSWESSACAMVAKHISAIQTTARENRTPSARGNCALILFQLILMG